MTHFSFIVTTYGSIRIIIHHITRYYLWSCEGSYVTDKNHKKIKIIPVRPWILGGVAVYPPRSSQHPSSFLPRRHCSLRASPLIRHCVVVRQHIIRRRDKSTTYNKRIHAHTRTAVSIVCQNLIHNALCDIIIHWRVAPNPSRDCRLHEISNVVTEGYCWLYESDIHFSTERVNTATRYLTI